MGVWDDQGQQNPGWLCVRVMPGVTRGRPQMPGTAKEHETKTNDTHNQSKRPSIGTTHRPSSRHHRQSSPRGKPPAHNNSHNSYELCIDHERVLIEVLFVIWLIGGSSWIAFCFFLGASIPVHVPFVAMPGKRVKRRSHSVDERSSTHAQKTHASSQPSLFSQTHSLTAQLEQPPTNPPPRTPSLRPPAHCWIPPPPPHLRHPADNGPPCTTSSIPPHHPPRHPPFAAPATLLSA